MLEASVLPQLAEMPVLNIVGERVGLGPLDREALPLLLRWGNDFETAELSGFDVRPRTREAVEQAFAPTFQEARPDTVRFAIHELATRRMIGTAGLREIDRGHRTAEFLIVIGEKDRRGVGFGTEATRLVLGYGFGVLGLHNVWLWARSDNGRAIRAYARAGFQEIGRRRGAYRVGDEVHDRVLMDCLATDFGRAAWRTVRP